MTSSQVSKLLFGDEDVVLRIPSAIIQIGKVFVPVESGHKGYWVQVKDRTVIVTRQNTWQTIAGLPSIYRFKGRLPELCQAGDAVSISGTVTMNPREKVFLSIWFGVMLVFLAVNLGQAALLAGRFMISSSSVPVDNLATIGFMLGSGALVALFGVAILVIVRLLFRSHRHELIEFCVHQNNKEWVAK